ncbi:RNA polymerase sigma-70 factor [Spirosoma daeguense]
MPTTLSEIELVHALSLGEVDAFDQLYHRYKQPVYANIFKMVKQPEAAEDILQEVFITLWENRQRVQTDKSVGGWLFVVSYNKAASFLKKKLKESMVVQQQPELPDTSAPEESLDEELFDVQLSLIEEAVSHLPARKKEVFRLLRFEGKTHEEVAESLGISVQSVRDYLKQATRSVKAHIQSRYGSPHSTALSLLLLFLDTY